MYWLGTEEYTCVFFNKKNPNPKARKEHECCECGEIIPVGAEYAYFSGKWYDPINIEYTFGHYRMCLNCDRDWAIVISVFHQNGQKEARMVFGRLSLAIEDALEERYLKGDESLVRRWFPPDIEPQTEEEIEDNLWNEIKADAIRKGLQPVLPGFMVP